MADIGYLAAFLGGALALLSPCSALLLPSFFAYAFQSPAALLGRTALFYAGLATTLVPLGAGSSWASALFYGHRELLILIAGWTIIALGTAQILGAGFALGPAAALQKWAAGRAGALPVFGLGAAYGLAGFCSGPILGSVLTVAAVGGQPLRGAALLAVYGLGMAAPLFVLALLWDRFDLGRRRWLRGRAFRIGPLQLHTTTLASGLLFIAIGVLFLAYDGTAGITGLLGLGDTTDLDASAQRWILALDVPDWIPMAAAALAVLSITGWRLRQLRRAERAAAGAARGQGPRRPGHWPPGSR